MKELKLFRSLASLILILILIVKPVVAYASSVVIMDTDLPFSVTGKSIASANETGKSNPNIKIELQDPVKNGEAKATVMKLSFPTYRLGNDVQNPIFHDFNLPGMKFFR